MGPALLLSNLWWKYTCRRHHIVILVTQSCRKFLLPNVFFLFPPEFKSFQRDCWGGCRVSRYWETTLDQKEKEKVGVMQSCICNNTSHVATVCSSATLSILHPCLFTGGEKSLFFQKRYNGFKIFVKLCLHYCMYVQV